MSIGCHSAGAVDSPPPEVAGTPHSGPVNENWLDARGSLLGNGFPLPLDEPFTAACAASHGVSRRQLAALVKAGLVRLVLHGVYAVAQAPHDLQLRAEALSLVLPDAAVVVDRTAAWLHGVDILPRSAVRVVPPLDVAHLSDTRMRRPEATGQRRGLLPSDVTTVGGIRVTTALRTTLDLGRMLWRYEALAAIDGFLRLGVPHDLLAAEVGRFRGYRGVRQLRALVPLGDGRAESPGESALRLHWYEAGLGRPELQWWVHADDGTPLYRLDIVDPELLHSAEYDGEEHHTSPEDQDHDAGRRTWLREHRGWTITGFDKEWVFGDKRGYLPAELRHDQKTARRQLGAWTPRRRNT